MKFKSVKHKTVHTLAILKPLTLCALVVGTPVLAAGTADPLLTSVNIEEIVLRDGEKSQNWDLEAWTSSDLNKFVIKAEGSRASGKTTEAEVQFLYSKAIAPYWDFQVGLRRDIKPAPGQSWAVLGLQGLAADYFDMDLSLFVNSGGQTELRIESEHEFMLTQKLSLTPSISAGFYGKNDSKRNIGKGLSAVETGLHLKYEITRAIAPYIGVNYEKLFGKTASFSKVENESTEEMQFVAGFQISF